MKLFQNSPLTCLLTLSAASFLLPAPASAVPTPGFKKVFIVVLENTDAPEALKQPFMKKLTSQGAYLGEFYAEGRPSQPNYIAMVAGSTLGVSSNANVDLPQSHIGDLLEAKGKSWKTYAEGFPGNCFLGATQGRYARKHEPFISFKNIQSNPQRCARIVDTAQFASDASAGKIADYSLFIPNLDNDGHDTGVAYADQWLERTFGALLKDRSFMQDMLFVVTFDEGNPSNPKNQIFTVLVGDSVIPGKVDNKRYTFHSLTRTIEDQFALGSLGLNDKTATPITDVWK
jgi:hypothetical protein